MCAAKNISKFIGTFKLHKHEGLETLLRANKVNEMMIKAAAKVPQVLVLDKKDGLFIHQHKIGPMTNWQKFKIGEPFEVSFSL